MIDAERLNAIREDADRRMDEADLDLTPSQRQTIRKIVVAGWRWAAGNDLQYYEKKEIKEFELELTSFGKVMLTVSIGQIGDEGTYAEVFARSRGHFFIGSRGGLTFYRKARNGSDGTVAEKGTRRLFLGWRSS